MNRVLEVILTAIEWMLIVGVVLTFLGLGWMFARDQIDAYHYRKAQRS